MDWPSAGRPSQKSVDRVVDRRARTCTAKGRSTTRSTTREPLLSGNGPIDQAVDRCVICQFTVDRPVDRWHNGQKSDRWPVDRAVDRQQFRLLSWTPTTTFLKPIKGASLGLFSTRFKESFWASFFYFFQWFYPHVLKPIFPNQKESLSRVFKSDLLSFSPQIQS